MQDKITFGKFIQSKRKEAGISQKVLAERLYVTESAVSKWERGISYPDITMISEICSALNITEHELCTASDDENQRKIERMAKKYKRFVAVYNIILSLGYLSAIIPCFIIFVIMEHDLPKFFILLTSLMLSASLLNVPTFVDKNKGLITLGSFYVSLDLLLLSGSFYSGGGWFLMAFLSVTLGLCIVFLPFVVRCELISRYIRNNKALICMAADTFLIFAVVAYGTLKYGVWSSFVTGMASAAVTLILVWTIFVLIRYAKVNIFIKSGAITGFTGIWLMTSEKLARRFLPVDGDFHIMINDEISTIKVGVAMVGMAVLLIIAGAALILGRKGDK